jgi:hypothetical protein
VNEVRTEQLRGEERIVKLKESILVQSQSVHYLNLGYYTLYDIIQDLLSTLINIRLLIFVKSWGMHLENRHTLCKICDFHRSEMKSSGMWHYADWYYWITQWHIPEICNCHLYSSVKHVLVFIYIKSTLYLKMLLKQTLTVYVCCKGWEYTVKNMWKYHDLIFSREDVRFCWKIFNSALYFKQTFFLNNIDICKLKCITLRITGFWTLSIIRYSKILENNVSETGSVSVLCWGKKTHGLLGPLERDDFKNWTISPLTWGQKQIYFLTCCVLVF